MEVIVLGGGYVGVCAARRLARAGSSVRVRLVSAEQCHAFHGWTAEVITGHVAPDRARVPLAELLPGVEIVSGTVTGVDLAAKTVTVSSGSTDSAVPRTLHYDELILGVGSHDAVERVPGLAAHGWSLKHDELKALNRHLSEVAAAAASTSSPAVRRRLLTVVVAGGGFAGTEAAGALVQRLRAEISARPALAGERPRVVLVSAGARLIPSLRPRFARAADYLEAGVARSGAQVRSGRRLASVSSVCAVLDDDTLIPTATVVSTIGQTPAALPGTESLPRDASGRLLTDRHLRVAPSVWAGGDVAAVPHPSGSGVCPANALWAIYHGKRAGANVVRTARGRRPAPFRFPGLGQAASLGVGRAAAELYGVQLTGWPAWLARWLFFHAFMPSRRVALATAAEWFRRPSLASYEPRPIARASYDVPAASLRTSYERGPITHASYDVHPEADLAEPA